MNSLTSPEGGVAATALGESPESTGPSIPTNSVSSASASKEQTWKTFAGRKGGSKNYQFGDFSRGFMARAAEVVREAKHHAGEELLKTQETLEQKMAERVEGFLDEKERQAAAAKEESPENREQRQSQATRLERWWRQACQLAHRKQPPNIDKPLEEQPEGTKGWVEVQVVAFGEGPEKPVLDANGSPATHPVCQLALDDRLTSALEVATSLPAVAARSGDSKGSNEDGNKAEGEEDEEEDDEEDAITSADSATFFFSELVGSDIRVHIWDSGNSGFRMGFEDTGFCGGAFIPLSTFYRRPGTVTDRMAQQMQCTDFESLVKVKLLPLTIMRAKSKLVPAEVSGAKDPEIEHGTVTLRVRLKLLAPYAKLRFQEEVNVTPSGLVSHQINDAGSTLKAAAGAIGRVGKTTQLFTLLHDGLHGLRESATSVVLLQLWWGFTAIKAPASLWPSLFALLFLAMAWSTSRQLGGMAACGTKNANLFVEDSDTPGQLEKISQTVKSLAKVQYSILTTSDNLSLAAIQVERVWYALSGDDTFASATAAAVILGVAALTGIAIETVKMACDRGLLRPIIWVLGLSLWVPQSVRDAQKRFGNDCADFLQGQFDDKLARRVSALWQRIPDAMETAHVTLAEQYCIDFQTAS